MGKQHHLSKRKGYRNGYEELRRECYFILNWFNKELKAQRDEAFEIFNAEYKKKLELEKEVKDFEVYDDIHTSKRKKDQFLTENGFKLVSSHFQDSKEEVGLRGALVLTTKFDPEIFLAVDCSPAGEKWMKD